MQEARLQLFQSGVQDAVQAGQAVILLMRTIVYQRGTHVMHCNVLQVGCNRVVQNSAAIQTVGEG